MPSGAAAGAKGRSPGRKSALSQENNSEPTEAEQECQISRKEMGAWRSSPGKDRDAPGGWGSPQRLDLPTRQRHTRVHTHTLKLPAPGRCRETPLELVKRQGLRLRKGVAALAPVRAAVKSTPALHRSRPQHGLMTHACGAFPRLPRGPNIQYHPSPRSSSCLQFNSTIIIP